MLRTKPGRSAIAAAVALVLCATGSPAQAQNDDLFDMSLEELVNLSVTSVSRKSEPLADTTSAVFVITREDIERQGIRSIPDALRLAPGLSVLQIDANKWAIGARGESGRFANKLLVLMDGRTLYTPSFSGVFWDVRSTLIEEIERIEVIRGPGATVWGSNATNGVINIITRQPDADAGTSILAGIDPEGSSFAAGQYSGAMGGSGAYRVFAKYHSANANRFVDGGEAFDDWDLLRGGVRAQWRNDRDEWSGSVEGYGGDMGESDVLFVPAPPYFSIAPNDASVSGGFATLRWNRARDGGTSSAADLIIDYTDRDAALYSETRTTLSFDGRHQWSRGAHEFIAGGQVRKNYYDFKNSARVSFVEDFMNIDEDLLVAVFLQDEITLKPDAVSLTLGVKLERNEFSPRSVEFMPTARLLWKPADDMSLWAGAARAVRTPSFADQGTESLDVLPARPPLTGPNPFPIPLRTASISNPDFESEVLAAYEAGLRGRFSDTMSYDVSVYVFDYENLRTFAGGDTVCQPSGVSVLVNPLCILSSTSATTEVQFTNEASSRTWGGEVQVDWLPMEALRVIAHASFAKQDLGRGLSGSAVPFQYPEWQAQLRAEYRYGPKLSLAAAFRYVDEIEVQDIDDYWQGNVNLRWQPTENWVLYLGVRNLFDDATLEYTSELFESLPTEIERSAYLNLRYDF
ncbi:MAG: TonB-dependent receptor [Pseudomonadota bacterium]